MSNTKLIFLCFSLMFALVSSPLLGATVSLAWTANPETDIAGYRIYRTTTPGTGYVRLNSTLVTTPSYTDPTCSAGATYYYAVTAVNTSSLESTKSSEVRASIPSSTTINTAPVANAGADQSVGSGVSVTLRGSGTDANGDALTYSWRQMSGTTVTLQNASTATASFTSPAVTANTTLVFRLTVSDGKGGTGTDDVNVVVTVPTSGTNAVPTANAGPDRYVLSRSTVTCYGSGSDPNGDPLTFSWHQIVGPTVVMNNKTSATMSFVAPAVTSDTRMRFRLWVRDNRGGGSYDDVTIRVTTNTSLVAPASVSTVTSLESPFVGVALLNASVAPSTVEISAVDQNGAAQLVDTSIFDTMSQRAFLAESLLTGHAGAVALKADGQSGDLKGFFLVGDGQPHRLDGIGGGFDIADRLYLTRAMSDANNKSLVFLTNPDTEFPAHVSMSLINSIGDATRTAALELAPGASRLATVSDLLGTSPISDDHYLSLSADLPVQSFQLMVDPETFSSSAGQSGTPARTLWIPHFVLGSQSEDTELRLINAGSETAQLTLRFYNDEAQLVASREASIPARGLFVQKLSQLLGLGVVPAGQPFLSGYIVADVQSSSTETPTLIGNVTFTAGSGKAKSTLPILNQSHPETLYLHVAQSAKDQVFTGLAVMNPNGEAATATVQAFDESGKMTAEKAIRIEAGQRLVDLLNGPRLFGPGFEQVGGHLKIKGDQPLVSFVVFADSQLRFFSAVEGQVPVL